MKPGTKNSYNSLIDIKINNKKFKIFSLQKAESNGLDGISKLPKSLKVLLENLRVIFKCGMGDCYVHLPVAEAL